MSMSIEVIDSATGRSATGISFTLWRKDNGWRELLTGQVSGAGRRPLVQARPGAEPTELALERGMYRLRLDLDMYFAGLGVTPSQPQVEVAFRVFYPGQQIRLLMMITPSSCDSHIVLSDEPAAEPTIANSTSRVRRYSIEE